MLTVFLEWHEGFQKSLEINSSRLWRPDGFSSGRNSAKWLLSITIYFLKAFILTFSPQRKKVQLEI